MNKIDKMEDVSERLSFVKLAPASLFKAVLSLVLLGVVSASAFAGSVVAYPFPANETASPDYSVRAGGKPIFVHTVDTLRAGPASFASFDFSGAVTVKVTTPQTVKSAQVLPASAGVKAVLEGNTIKLRLKKPCQLTVELNSGSEHPLHLFANAIEQDAPERSDTNVIYFGPGAHDLAPLRLKSNQTLYLAGGAVVRPTIQPGEKPVHEKDWAGATNYAQLCIAQGARNVTVRGRGVLDLSRLPWHARTAFVFSGCTHVLVEGIVILDSPAWGLAFFGCNDVTVRNVKQICRHENSDGIDLCNTQNALVEDCFLRNNDDEICVKTTSPPPAQESKNIVVQRCVVWNERARGLGITSETRTDISHVVFRDCDIIHDFSAGGDCAALAVLVSDSGTMSDILFEDIRVNEAHKTLFNGWIGADFWGHDPMRGHVKNLKLRNITATGPIRPESKLSGYDAAHQFEDVIFENIWIGGKRIDSLESGRITVNEYVENVKVVGRR